MTFEPAKLIPQGLTGDAVILLVPLRPVFPLVATTPAGQNHDSHLVRKIEEVIIFNFAFESNGVQIQIAYIIQFSLLPFG